MGHKKKKGKQAGRQAAGPKPDDEAEDAAAGDGGSSAQMTSSSATTSSPSTPQLPSQVPSHPSSATPEPPTDRLAESAPMKDALKTATSNASSAGSASAITAPRKVTVTGKKPVQERPYVKPICVPFADLSSLSPAASTLAERVQRINGLELGLQDTDVARVRKWVDENYSDADIELIEASDLHTSLNLPLGKAKRLATILRAAALPTVISPQERLFRALVLEGDREEKHYVDFKAAFDYAGSDKEKFLQEIAALHNAVRVGVPDYPSVDGMHKAAYLIIGIANNVNAAHPELVNQLVLEPAPRSRDDQLLQEPFKRFSPVPMVNKYIIPCVGNKGGERVTGVCIMFEIVIGQHPILLDGKIFVRVNTTTVHAPSISSLPKEYADPLYAKFSALDESDQAMARLRQLPDYEAGLALKILLLSSHRESSNDAVTLMDQLMAVNWDIVVDLDRNSNAPESAWRRVADIVNLRRNLHDVSIGEAKARLFDPPLTDSNVKECIAGKVLLWVKGCTGANRDDFKYFPVQELICSDIFNVCPPRPIIIVSIALAPEQSRIITTLGEVVKWIQQRDTFANTHPLYVARCALPDAIGSSANIAQEERMFSAPLFTITSNVCNLLGAVLPPDHIMMAKIRIPALNRNEWLTVLEPVHASLGEPETSEAAIELEQAVRSFGAIPAQASEGEEPDARIQFGRYIVSFSKKSVVLSGEKLLYLDFLRGSTLSWSLLHASSDPRSYIHELFRRSEFDPICKTIGELLRRPAEKWLDRPTVVLCSHEASAGASTLGRQLLKHFADEFPCFVVRDTSDVTVDQLALAQQKFFANKPFLLMLDNTTGHKAEEFDRKMHHQHPRRAKAVIIAIARTNVRQDVAHRKPDAKLVQLTTKDAESLQLQVERQIASILAPVQKADFDIKMPFFYGLVYFGVYYSDERIRNHVSNCVAALWQAPDDDQQSIAGMLCVAVLLKLHVPSNIASGLLRSYAEELVSRTYLNTRPDRSVLASALLNLLLVRRSGANMIFSLPNEKTALTLQEELQKRMSLPPVVFGLVWLLTRLFNFENGPLDTLEYRSAAVGASRGPNVTVTSDASAGTQLLNVIMEKALPAVHELLESGHLPAALAAMTAPDLKPLLTALFSRHGEGEANDVAPASETDDDIFDLSPAQSANLRPNAVTSNRRSLAGFSEFVDYLQRESVVGPAYTKALFALAAVATGDVHVLSHYSRFVVLSAIAAEDVDGMLRGLDIIRRTLTSPHVRDAPPRLCHLGGALALRVVKSFLYMPVDKMQLDLSAGILDNVRRCADLAEELLLKINEHPRGLDNEGYSVAVLRQVWRVDLRVALHKFARKWSWANGMSPDKFLRQEAKSSLFMKDDVLVREGLQLLDHAEELNGLSSDSLSSRRQQTIFDRQVDVLRLLSPDPERHLSTQQLAEHLKGQFRNTSLADVLPALAGHLLFMAHGNTRGPRWRPFSGADISADELLDTFATLRAAANKAANARVRLPLVAVRDLLHVIAEMGCRGIGMDEKHLQALEILNLLSHVKTSVVNEHRPTTDPVLWVLYGAVAFSLLNGLGAAPEAARLTKMAMGNLKEANEKLRQLAGQSPLVHDAANTTAFLFVAQGRAVHCIRDKSYIRATLDENSYEDASVFWSYLAFDRLWRIPGQLRNNGREGVVRFGQDELTARVTHLHGVPGRNDMSVEFYPVMSNEGLVLSVARVVGVTIGRSGT